MCVKVKICGLKTEEAVIAAVQNGADFLGFVFFDKSPRDISPIDAKPLVELARALNPEIAICAVTVNPNDELLGQIRVAIAPDFVQIHGDIDPNRMAEIKAQGFKIILAIGVSESSDLARAKAFESVADYILFDAKPPKGAQNAGGFGVAFDWSVLANYHGEGPWFLSGGLNPLNVKEAIAATNAIMIDVSSGIESAAGVKDLTLIKTFLNEAKGQ